MQDIVNGSLQNNTRTQYRGLHNHNYLHYFGVPYNYNTMGPPKPYLITKAPILETNPCGELLLAARVRFFKEAAHGIAGLQTPGAFRGATV